MTEHEPPPPSYEARTTKFLEKPSRRTAGLAVAAVVLVAAAGFGLAKLGKGGRHLRPVAYTASGEAEIRRSDNGSVRRWRHDATLRIVLDDSLDAIGPGAKDAVRNAVGAWLASGANLPNVTFDTAHGLGFPNGLDGVSTVVFAPIPIEHHQSDLAITIPAADAETGAIQEVDIVINSSHKFAVLGEDAEPADANAADEKVEKGKCPPAAKAGACGGQYDLQNVVTHEVGHFFGLGEDWTDSRATMFACSSSCQVHKRALRDDDRAAIQQVYAAPDADAPEAGVQCSVGARRAASGATSLGALLAMGAALGRRRRRA